MPFGTGLNALKTFHLQQDNSLKKFLRNNSYLLVIAAWLVTLSFIVDNYWSANSSVKAVQKKLTNYIHQQEKDFETIVADTALLNKLVYKKFDEPTLQAYTEKPYFLFVYPAITPTADNLLFWNTQMVQPDSLLLNDTANAGFRQLANGYYIWRRTVAGPFMAVALVPVKWNYSTPSDYLPNSFAVGDKIENNYDISMQEGSATVQSLHGNQLFYLYQKAGALPKNNTQLAIWSRLAAILCLFLFLHLLASRLAQYYGTAVGAGFLISLILLLRISSYYIPLPLNMRQFNLFSPSVYGSNAILRSLGDLLINAGLFVWLILFVRQQLAAKKTVPLPKSTAGRLIVIAIGILLLVAASIIGGNILRSLIADSTIPFDVVDFAKLNLYSVVGLLVICCVAIGYFLLAQVVLFFIKPLFKRRPYYLYLTIAIASLIMLTLRLGNKQAALELSICAWLMLFVYLLNNSYFSMLTTRFVSSRLVFWLFFFSISITTIIVIQNNKKEIEERKHFAETLSKKANPAYERTMNTILTDFRNDFLAANFYRFQTDSLGTFKDSLVDGNFSSYKNKFDTRIYTFDANEQPLFNPDSTTFNGFVSIMNSQALPTSIEDLKYYDVSFDMYRYICHRKVRTSDSTNTLLGHVFILATPSKYKSDALYPELFSKGYNNSIENSPVHAFAVYDKLKLVGRHNDYNFATSLQPDEVPQDEFKQLSVNGYDELWHRAGADKVVIIARQENYIIASITLFSYLFCAFLLVTAILWLLHAFVHARLSGYRWRQYWQLTIRNQVHATIIFISILSFLVIGIATIIFFINRYENTNREKLSKAMEVMEKEVRNSLGRLIVDDDVIKVYDRENMQELRQSISRIADVYSADINLYDLEGNLKISTQPLPYNKGIVSTKINPLAYYHLKELRKAQYFKKEQIGSLIYLSNYIPVTDDQGNLYAYLNTPYFMSQAGLRQEISNFFVAIINLNAFIFLIAGLVAFFIANRITRSFSFISDKMQDVNLGKQNQAIVWNRNDEIGQLVNEYNKMVAKLEESAATLAKSEREDAWREMARQVAHEIKNPLTPMKLSLQYLQKSISEGAPNIQELSGNVANTLVEQIDHLSQIAGEFSQFANIGSPKKEVFDLNETLRQVTQLHYTEDIVLIWVAHPVALLVNADRTQMNRLFTNLLQNAIQAVQPGKTPQITVTNTADTEKVRIAITDNGSGIPEDTRERIFTPNFTTKTSGTGLGLAMCKGIVEQAHGNIWFDTVIDGGTTFYVELPLSQNL